MKKFKIAQEPPFVGEQTLHLVLRLRGGGCSCGQCESCVQLIFDQNQSRAKKIEDPLNDLIELQNANGSFKFGSALKCSEDKLKNTCPQKQHLDAWITAYAVTILEEKFADQKTLWELVAEKAKNYVKKIVKTKFDNFMRQTLQLF